MYHFFPRLAISLELTSAFFLFGFLILIVFSNNKKQQDRFEYFLTALVIGVSVAIAIPIVLGLFEISPTSNNLQFFFVLFILILLICLSLRIVRKGLALPTFEKGKISDFYILSGFYLILISLRIVQINEIFVPNWVDGLIHTQLLARLEVSEKISFGRIYHVGFHSCALLIHYFLRLSLSDAVLLFGQWLSATCGVTFYLLARRYVRIFYFSFFSLVIYSLILLFPSFLVFWGRYPFLLGLTILPLAMVTGWDWVSRRNEKFFLSFFLASILAMTHYGTFIVWFSFILINLIFQLSSKNKNARHVFSIWPSLRRFLILNTSLAFIALPKISNLLEHKEILMHLTTKAANINFADDLVPVLARVFQHDYLLLSFVFAGVIVSAVWRKKTFWIMIFWPATVGGIIWVQYWLFRFSVSSYSNLIVFLSIPVSIVSGLTIKYLFLLDKSFTGMTKINKFIVQTTSILAFIFVGIWSNLTLFDSKTILFSVRDYTAMEWIRENTPKDSVFFVESFLWGDKLMPSDGGGWIELLTNRKAVYPKEIGDLYDMCVFINEHGIDYLYLNDGSYEDNFGLDLSDINGKYETIYSKGSIVIVSVICS